MLVADWTGEIATAIEDVKPTDGEPKYRYHSPATYLRWLRIAQLWLAERLPPEEVACLIVRLQFYYDADGLDIVRAASTYPQLGKIQKLLIDGVSTEGEKATAVALADAPYYTTEAPLHSTDESHAWWYDGNDHLFLTPVPEAGQQNQGVIRFIRRPKQLVTSGATVDQTTVPELSERWQEVAFFHALARAFSFHKEKELALEYRQMAYAEIDTAWKENPRETSMWRSGTINLGRGIS